MIPLDMSANPFASSLFAETLIPEQCGDAALFHTPGKFSTIVTGGFAYQVRNKAICPNGCECNEYLATVSLFYFDVHWNKNKDKIIETNVVVNEFGAMFPEEVLPNKTGITQYKSPLAVNAQVLFETDPKRHNRWICADCQMMAPRGAFASDIPLDFGHPDPWSSNHMLRIKNQLPAGTHYAYPLKHANHDTLEMVHLVIPGNGPRFTELSSEEILLFSSFILSSDLHGDIRQFHTKDLFQHFTVVRCDAGCIFFDPSTNDPGYLASHEATRKLAVFCEQKNENPFDFYDQT